MAEPMSATPSTGRHRAWFTTAEVCEWLGISRETLRQLRLRGVLQPGKHFRRWGCTQGKGPLSFPKPIEKSVTLTPYFLA